MENQEKTKRGKNKTIQKIITNDHNAGVPPPPENTLEPPLVMQTISIYGRQGGSQTTILACLYEN